MTTGRPSPIVGVANQPTGDAWNQELAKEVEELAAHSAGNTLLVVALASALIDAKAVTTEQVIAAIAAAKSACRDAMNDTVFTPLDQCAEMLAATQGSLGHVGNLGFAGVQSFLDRLSGKDHGAREDDPSPP